MKSTHFIELMFILLSGALLLSAPLQAQDLSIKQRILMPGEVIEGHAEFESECEKCHASFEKDDLPRLCQGCHEDIDIDRRSGKGFHGQDPFASKKPCNTCHDDHLGRDADIIQMHRDVFDHKWTRFPLVGSHEAVDCKDCHKPEQKKYRDAEPQCVSCHKKDDFHKGALGKECESCHEPVSWQKRLDFDHSTADFLLEGKHKKVACSSCHAGQIYEFEQTTCVSCHKAIDVHGGKNGQECDSCHSVEGWDKQTFNHFETDFPLRFKHKQIPCRACHVDGVIKKEMPTNCSSCHANDGIHLGRNGDQCEDCHKTESWSLVSFDHHLKTGFPLLGQHKKNACTQCHAGALTEPMGRDCASCHAGDDAHKNPNMQLCGTCHTPDKWKTINQFDHQITDFPLMGLHSIVPCQNCHLGNQFAGTDSKCVSCHKANDHHEGALGAECSSCHSPNSWNIWQFNHEEFTDYALQGTHEGLACNACHKPGTDPSRTPKICAGCHSSQDIHNGGFGKNCGRCHSQNRFFELILQGFDR